VTLREASASDEPALLTFLERMRPESRDGVNTVELPTSAWREAHERFAHSSG
jgi:hypothetical protein